MQVSMFNTHCELRQIAEGVVIVGKQTLPFLEPPDSCIRFCCAFAAFRPLIVATPFFHTSPFMQI